MKTVNVNESMISMNLTISGDSTTTAKVSYLTDPTLNFKKKKKKLSQRTMFWLES